MLLVVRVSAEEPTYEMAAHVLSPIAGTNTESEDPQTGASSPSRDTQAATGPDNKSLLRRGLDDQKQIYLAPLHRKNIKWDLLFLAGTGGLIAADPHISRHVPRDGIDISRDISNAGLYSTSAVVAGLLIYGVKNDDSHARETGVFALESLTNTAAVLALIQVTAGRQRPTEGDGYGRFWRDNTLGSSFPSAHSSFTWTMASVLAHEYPKPWVQWLAYGTATAVSVTRVTGLKHFSADVEVGGVFGYLIGRQVFHSHCSLGLNPRCHASKNNSLSEELPNLDAGAR